MTAPIAAEHHSCGLTASFPCHFQCIHGESTVQRERHCPAHWLSCEQVENKGEVRPAPACPDTGHITAPGLALLLRTVAQDDSGQQRVHARHVYTGESAAGN